MWSATYLRGKSEDGRDYAIERSAVGPNDEFFVVFRGKSVPGRSTARKVYSDALIDTARTLREAKALAQRDASFARSNRGERRNGKGRRLKSAPIIRVVEDGEIAWEGTLTSFAAANADDPYIVNEIKKLRPGQSYRVGIGGGWGARVERVTTRANPSGPPVAITVKETARARLRHAPLGWEVWDKTMGPLSSGHGVYIYRDREEAEKAYRSIK